MRGPGFCGCSRAFSCGCFRVWSRVLRLLVCVVQGPTVVHLEPKCSTRLRGLNLSFSLRQWTICALLKVLIMISPRTTTFNFDVYCIMLYTIVYTVHCTLYSVHCTLYIVHCTLYSTHCTLYNVHCTMYGYAISFYYSHNSLYNYKI